jgi:hypothetical protein
MIQSRPIDVDGRFVGVAVNASAQWHFVAVDPRVEDLHGALFATPEEVARVARLALLRSTGAAMPWMGGGLNGRSGGIRTHDPQSPRLMRYQAALHSDCGGA